MAKKYKLYLSGPISGLERDEYMARFAYAEELARKDGYDVCNPTRLLPCRWPWLYRLMGYDLTLRYDIWHMKRCDYVYFLPGWLGSKGARREWSVAVRHGKPSVLYHHIWERKLSEYINNNKSITKEE